MASLQDQYDDAMFDFSGGRFDEAIAKLQRVLAEDPQHFDAQLAVGMAYYRKGDYATAIAEGHKAEKLKPREQLVHTNLSLFYMKTGDKKTAEHHGLQARIASWREPVPTPGEQQTTDPELKMAKPPTPAIKPPEKFPDMPWKKKKPETHG
jgi:tetratricopeptide (TPR) repeat protein